MKVSYKGLGRNGKDEPLDDLACDDTLFGVKETDGSRLDGSAH